MVRPYHIDHAGALLQTAEESEDGDQHKRQAEEYAQNGGGHEAAHLRALVEEREVMVVAVHRVAQHYHEPCYHLEGN